MKDVGWIPVQEKEYLQLLLWRVRQIKGITHQAWLANHGKKLIAKFYFVGKNEGKAPSLYVSNLRVKQALKESRTVNIYVSLCFVAAAEFHLQPVTIYFARNSIECPKLDLKLTVLS